jgi:hypothetical protein
MIKFVASILLVCCTLLWSCTEKQEQGSSNVQTGNGPVLELLDGNTFDFGTVQEGEVVEHTFKFKNAGSEPLVISNITSSCGCTTPEWPHEPIAPDSISSVQVRFDTKNKVGSQLKSVSIYANTDPVNTDLVLRGTSNAIEKPE